ncbi:MAG TPA: DUF4340 domain-containing protein [Planctomycetota bacterium]|nr:DUF4340 domain-containing protein [Planctomycetota bacterium]
MNDLARTLVHAGIAAALVALAIVSRPALPKSAVFEDQGKPFYPDFSDPLAAASLEITDYDEALARVRRFKVVLQDGKYVIPSKWNHPADAKDRLAKTAAAMIGLRKESVGSDQPKDHEMYGVVDPVETSEGTAGRGSRVILRDAAGRVLSDLVFGKSVKDKPGSRYVRLPGHKRVYEAKVPYETSAKFSDWVETDLLQVSSSQLKKLELNTYTVDEEAQRVKDHDVQILVKDATGTWKLELIAPTEELRKEAVDEMTGALDELKIVDVRRKPDELAKAFRREKASLKRADIGDLRQRGFTVSQGQVYANEGELLVHADDGVVYRIWFGEVVSDADEGKELDKESRYLLIQTLFDEAEFPAEPEPKDTKPDGTPKTDEEKKKDQDEYESKKRERDSKIEAGKKREKELARRFADWYYVIPAESFKKLRKVKADLVKKADEKRPEDKKPEEKKEPEKPK